MWRGIALSLGVLVVGLLIERQVSSEYIAFLERDIMIEQGHRNIKEGMTEVEVARLINLEPDSVYQISDEPGVTQKNWEIKNHIGTLHRLLGLSPRHEKSYMELHLNFDRSGKLIRIYYGG